MTSPYYPRLSVLQSLIALNRQKESRLQAVVSSPESSPEERAKALNNMARLLHEIDTLHKDLAALKSPRF